MDELRIVLKRREDIKAFLGAKEALGVEGNVDALRALIRAYQEHDEWKKYKSQVDLARRLRDAEERVKALEEELELRERYIRLADERLMFYMLRWNPGKVQRLRNILEIAWEKDRAFSAKTLRLELGIGMPGLRRDLKELLEYALLVKPKYGLYALAPGVRMDNPVRLIAKRMARKDVEKRIKEKDE